MNLKGVGVEVETVMVVTEELGGGIEVRLMMGWDKLV
jgi:hypothetical protein